MLPDDDAPARIVGIDDWSWRKSWRYGTIIVDLERRKVVDILDDRSVVSVAQWLKRHLSIEVVSRDRCGLYAQAAREGAPQASQVALLMFNIDRGNSGVSTPAGSRRIWTSTNQKNSRT
jgi:transposase